MVCQGSCDNKPIIEMLLDTNGATRFLLQQRHIDRILGTILSNIQRYEMLMVFRIHVNSFT